MIYLQGTVEGVQANQLRGFFVGWPNPPSPETHLKLLSQSDEIVLAVDDQTKQVVGFITAISDGVLSAYIPHLEVLPDYQHQGIGKQLVEAMLYKLSGLYMVDLVCDPPLQAFYERFGLQRASAMIKRNYQRQSGPA